MSRNTILILGARSDIAIAVAHQFAKEGFDIQLAARQATNLNIHQADIELRYQVTTTLHEFDALESDTHESFVKHLPTLPDIAVCAVGFMGEQSENKQSAYAILKIIRSNYEGPVSILGELAKKFEQRGTGILIGISSVAGERGRASNYIYGSAKAGFTAFLSGLRNELSSKGVHVITVLPGFVTTQMTKNMNLPPLLTATPSDVASAIYKSSSKRSNVVYVQKKWMLIMLLIRLIPESIFKLTKI